MKHLYSLALILLAIAGSAQVPTLDDVWESNDLMGMSVLYVCQNQISGIHNYGLKDHTRQLDIDDSTMYRIASISKAITATGAMALVDQGLLDLDADISDYLGFTARNPLYPDDVVTVGMLMSHQSSIQDGDGYYNFLNATYVSDTDLPDIQELLDPEGAYFTSNVWRTEQPGTWFTYSNLNYGVLATVMEAASGQRFDLLMEDLLFEPMGLACTYNVGHIDNIDNLAVLYRNQGGWNPQVDNYQGNAPDSPPLTDYTPGGNGLRFAPQGGLRSSVHDLGRLMQLHIGEGYDPATQQQLISTETMQLMHETQWTDNGSNGDDYFNLFNSWTYGLHHITDTGDTVFPNEGSVGLLGHPGEAYGLISDWFLDKETNGGFVFMTNGSWNGFSFGDISSWYSLEEEVFEVAEAFLYNNCGVNVKEEQIRPLTVFPNPARPGDRLRVSFMSDTLRLLDLQGKLLFEVKVDRGHIVVPELAAGTYLLQSDTKSARQSSRLIIQ